MTTVEPIPKDWELKAIAELGKIYSGSTPSTRVEAYWNGDIVWITPNDLSKLNTRFIEISERKITSQGLKNCSANLLPANSLVISSRAPIGYLALPTTDFCTNQGCKSIVFNEEQEPDFHYYNFSFRIKQIREKGEGTTFAEISKTALEQIEFPVPKDKQTQTKIAEVLTAVDHTIAQTEALIAKYQRIKTGLMQDLLTRGIDEDGRLRDPATHEFKDSPFGLIPKEWDVCRLEDLTTKIVDGVHHTPKYVEYGIPFVTVKNLTGSSTIDLEDINYISEEDHKTFLKRTDPQPGDILVTKDGTLGVAKIVPMQFPIFNIFVSVALLRPNFTRCIPELIWLFFESGSFEVQLSHLSAGTGLKHIHLEHFREFRIATPPLKEQPKIAMVLNKIEDELAIEIFQLHKLQRLKSGLMQDLLTGKVSIAPLLKEQEE